MSGSNQPNETHHHHHHHHHHYHHHYHYQHDAPQGFTGPRPDQHFNPHPQHSGSGADYWGNFGATWGEGPGGRQYPFNGGPGQGYGNLGGQAGGQRGYSGSGHPY